MEAVAAWNVALAATAALGSLLWATRLVVARPAVHSAWRLPCAAALGTAGLLASFLVLECLAPDSASARGWDLAQYLLGPVLPATWLFAVFELVRDRARPRGGVTGLIAASPVLLIACALTNPVHGLMWSEAPVAKALGGELPKDYGPLLALIPLYVVACSSIGAAVIVRRTLRAGGSGAGGSLALCGGLLAAPLGSIADLTLGAHGGVSIAEFSIILSAWIVCGVLLTRTRPALIAGMSRSALVEGMRDAIVILDAAGAVVELNGVARSLLRAERRGVRRRPLEEVAPGLARVLGPVPPHGESREVRFRGSGSEDRVWEASITAVQAWDGSRAGTVISLRDATGRWRARAAMVRERNLLRALADSSAAQVFVKDREGRFLLANRTVIHGLGAASEEDIIGKTDFDLFDREIAEGHWAEEREIFESGVGFTNREITWIDSQGDPNWALSTKHPFRDASGEIVGLVGVNMPVTQLRLAVEEARLRGERYRLIVQTANEGILASDADGRITLANQRVAELVGHSVDSLIGQPETVVLAPADLEDHCVRMAERRRGESATYERWITSSAGSARLCLVSAAPLMGDDGSYEGCFAMLTDITDRRAAEDELRLERQRLEALLELSRMAEDDEAQIIDYALEQAVALTRSRIGYLAFLDPGETTLTMYAWSREAKDACHVPDPVLVYPVASTGLWGEAVRQRRPIVTNDYSAECPWKRGLPEGHVPLARHMNVPVFSGERLVLVAGVGNKEVDYDEADVRQLTLLMRGMWALLERRRAESERRELLMRVERKERLEGLGVLAGGVAHDFNNALQAIVGGLDLVRLDASASPTVLAHMESIARAAGRARALVQQILTFARRAPADRQPFAVAEVVEEALALLRAGVPSTIRIECRVDPELGCAIGDASLIHQVLVNLGANAQHAMREGGGTLTLTAEACALEVHPADAPSLRPGRYARIEIGDTGVGMAEEVRQRVFEPFFTTKGPGEGVGLGLAASHGIVVSHGGAITVASRPGEGSVFTVYLPLTAEQPVPGRGSEARQPIGGGERLLLVDDEEAVRETTAGMLEALGYRVVSLGHSLEAASALEADPFCCDALVTDQTMPGLTGLELIARARLLRPELPTLLLTGYSPLVRPDEATPGGADRVLLKPYTIQALGEAVRAVLDTPTTKDDAP